MKLSPEHRALILDRRNELGLTLAQAAKGVGIKHVSWMRIEKGHRGVGDDTIERIAELLGLEFKVTLEKR